MSAEKSLRANLADPLRLPEPVIEWLMDLWGAIQGLDDLVDGEQQSLPEQYGLIWRVLISMPSNSFYQAHANALLPVMANAYLKWRAAETVERGKLKDHYEKSFMWRASYYDVVLQCVLLVHGPERAAVLAATALALYGESLESYRKEFVDA